MKLGYLKSDFLPREIFIIDRDQRLQISEIDSVKDLERFTPKNNDEILFLIKFYESFFDHVFTVKSNEIINEITFFGGSFNPWHEGHQACIKLLKNYLNKKHQLIVLPDINPWKNNELIPLLDRWEIYQNLLIKTNELIYPSFLFLDQKNPTYKWVTKLKSNQPTLKINLLMGFDSFSNLDKWYESEKLLKILNHIFVASRNDDLSVKNQRLEEYKKADPTLKVTFLGNHEHEDLSSTKLRQTLRQSSNK